MEALTPASLTAAGRASMAADRPLDQTQNQERQAPGKTVLQSFANSRTGQALALIPIRGVSSAVLALGIAAAGVAVVTGTSALPGLIVGVAGAAALGAGSVAATHRKDEPESRSEAVRNATVAVVFTVYATLATFSALYPRSPEQAPQ